jgi:GR25 family glycosyltransferase involved in LPS biosynthesis|tara:strand:+ start:1442 stop:2359 length:918 start_codon:yes stop_codon:yes gene_type:complete
MSTIGGRGLTVGGISGIMEREFPQQDLGVDGVMKRTKHTMKAYIISMLNDHDSTVATRRLLRSIESTESNIDAMSFNAVTPETMDNNINRLFGSQMPYAKIQYTYPKTEAENRLDILSGLKLSAYPTKDLRKRISCFLSHYSLWRLCFQMKEPIMILEHDALFLRTFNFEDISARVTGNILGLNDPIGATRRANVYHNHCKTRYENILTGWQMDNAGKNKKERSPEYQLFTAPNVDNDNQIPQGLAGNSAYVIRPEGAANLMGLVAEHGFWPNDAIMCKQLLPKQLMQIYPYVTKVQGTTSTTST